MRKTTRTSHETVHDPRAMHGLRGLWGRRSEWSRVLRGEVLGMEPGALRHIVDVAGLVAHGIYRTQLPRMAAALAYRTIFALIPVLVLVLLFLGSLSSDQQIEESLTQLLKFTGLSEIAVAPSADPLTASAATEGSAAGANRSGGQKQLSTWIGDIVQNVRASPFKTIGIIGLIALIYGAISMLVEMEQVFNDIYRAISERTWGQRIPRYWSLLTLGSLFLIASFVVGEQFRNWVATRVEPGVWGGLGQVIVTLLGFLTTVAISTLLWVLVYTIIPATHVSFRSALAGAFVAAVLWETGKWGFTHYLSYATGYARLYGSIALIPLFLIWIYVTWIIVLFGLNISYALQHFRTWREVQSKPAKIAEFVDPAAILLVMGVVARMFRAGQPADAESVDHQIGLDERSIQSMLNGLSAAGLLRRIDDATSNKADLTRYVLARPAESITAEEVLDVGRSLAQPGASGKGHDLLERLRESQHRALESKTVADLAAEMESEERCPEPETMISRTSEPSVVSAAGRSRGD